MKPKRDLTGKVFGRLTVLRFYMRIKIGGIGPKRNLWLALCECGNEHVVADRGLLHPTKPCRSCGCLSKECRKNNRPPRRKKEAVPT